MCTQVNIMFKTYYSIQSSYPPVLPDAQCTFISSKSTLGFSHNLIISAILSLILASYLFILSNKSDWVWYWNTAAQYHFRNVRKLQYKFFLGAQEQIKAQEKLYETKMTKDNWKFHENQAQLSPIRDCQAYVDTKMDD